MEIHLQIIGILLMLLALMHAFFPKYFNWNTELKSLSLINRQMMQVHTFFIAFILFLMGLFSLESSAEFIQNPLGKKISLGFGVFWLTRFLMQFFVYSPQLWKGKFFETCMHILFSILWAYLSLVYWLIYIF